MKHLIVTTNDPASLSAMESYRGTTLIHSDEDFAFWYCTNLSPDDISKIIGDSVAQEVKLSGMILLNKPA